MKNFTSVINSDTPVLVDFMLGEQADYDGLSYTLKEVREALGERLKVIMVDVNKNIDVMREYKSLYLIGELPALMLFRNGKILWRETGLLLKTEIMKNIVYNLK